MNVLECISPIDGRYNDETKKLQSYFSEMALQKYRVKVEVEYFIALSLEKGVPQLPPLTPHGQKSLRSWYENFSLSDAEEIKIQEKITKHDVKAVEYFLQQKMSSTPLKSFTSFIHFALTSEDINNIAYALMWKEALTEVFLPEVETLTELLFSLGKQYRKVPLLSLTHGQPATPTTLGKEFLVFAYRLKRQKDFLSRHTLQAKLNGATGTFAAHQIAYPQVNWKKFSADFITGLGLEPNLFTTQIEPHDSLVESFQFLHHMNSILIDFSRDLWLYISRGIFTQKKKEGEVGSSVMPHKINPIHFENAEGNLGLANSFFSHLADKFPISRLQRDLSDSTVMRNIGVPLAHTLLAYKNISQGLNRLEVNTHKTEEELNNHFEVLAEPIQTLLRKYGDEKGYEKLKELTRGETITPEILHRCIDDLSLPENEKERLRKLTPATYLGYADEE